VSPGATTEAAAPGAERPDAHPPGYGAARAGARQGAPPPLWLAAVACAALFTATAAFRLVLFPHVVLPIAYGVPLVLMSWFRRRRFLWLLAAGFTAVTLLKNFYVYPHAIHPEGLVGLNSRVWATAMIVVDLAAITSVLHAWVVVRERAEERTRQLEASNRELAAREEEIARQNEEMQSQSEELERQSEELRAANDELLRRERSLETLLTLSRSLTADLPRGETMNRICEALAQLITGPATPAAAILEQEPDGSRLTVRCHTGFGPLGPDAAAIPTADSFASLVLTRGRTAYIEDLALRPDLRVPQPKDPSRPRMASVLATPLRVAGWPVGTLELYGAQKTAWSEEQVALAESLAAQASVSLEAAKLFEAVAQERRRLETVLRTVPFGVGVANADASSVRLNPAGAVIFGVPADANLAAEPVYARVRISHEGRALAPENYPLRRVLREGQDLRGEFELALPDGRRAILLIHASPVRDREGNVTGSVAAFVDITAQKELQRELDTRRREAEEGSVRKTRFLAAVSHDIRTPANAISLLAELIRRTATNPAMAAEVPGLAEELHASAMSLVNLLGDVLDVARFDSGKIDIQESEFSLAEMLADEFRRMQPLAREKGLSMDYAPPAEPVYLRADRIKLSRVVGNLLGNAIKFTDAGGTVRLEGSRSEQGWALVRVADTGVGIAPEHQRNIFDEFFQLRNPERDRNKGTGLGLTICKRLVDAMGGTIAVESTPGSGSTFTVTIPPPDALPTAASFGA
jgi:PAS domain S-box-containing protein